MNCSVKSNLLQQFVKFHSSSVATFNVRLCYSFRKISEALHGIEEQLLSPDTELDDLILTRERKMNREFIIRFSRNSLYAIHLKLSQLEHEIITFQCSRCCKISKASVLRSLILSLISSFSQSTRVYEKFLKKSKLKCVSKLDDLINYLRSALSMMTYIVDTSIVEMLDISDSISLILDLSKNLKFKASSASCKIGPVSAKEFPVNKKTLSKVTKKGKFITGKDVIRPDAKILRKCRGTTHAFQHVAPSSCFDSCTRTSSETHLKNTENVVDQEKQKPKDYSLLKLRKIYFELSNNFLSELVNELIHDITECMSHLITDAYKRELVNVSR